MKRISLLVLCLAMFLGGCASTQSKSTSEISNDAPIDKIVAKADQAAVAGDYLAASTLYRHALNLKPDVDVWFRLGMSLVMLDKPEQAQWAFRNVLALEPEHRGALQQVALYLTSHGKVEEARSYLERLMTIDPDNWRAHNALGVVADLEGVPDEAVAHYRRAIDLNPDAAMLWNNLGYSMYLNENMLAAEENIRRAMALDPNYGPAKRNLALVYACQGLYSEALNIMLTAENEATAFTDVGLLAAKLGDYDQAEVLLAEAVRRSPIYNAAASRNLAAIREAIRETADNG